MSKNSLYKFVLTLFLLITSISSFTVKSYAEESKHIVAPKPQHIFSGLEASPDIIKLSQHRNEINAEASRLSDKRSEIFVMLEKSISDNLSEFEVTHDRKILKNKMVKVILPFVREMKIISDSSNALADRLRSHRQELTGIELFSPESVENVHKEYELEKKNYHLSKSTINSLVEEQFGGDPMKLEEAAANDPFIRDYVNELITMGDLAENRLNDLRDNLGKIKNSEKIIRKLGGSLDSTWADVRQFKRNTYLIASKYRSWAEKIQISEIGDIINELTNGYLNLKKVTDSMTVIQIEQDNRFEEIINSELISSDVTLDKDEPVINSAKGLGERVRKFLENKSDNTEE